MSKVWSRCLSINRKTQLKNKEEDFDGILRSGNERKVFVERGYEVVPRIVSTHLARSRDGLREVDQSQVSHESFSNQ